MLHFMQFETHRRLRRRNGQRSVPFLLHGVGMAALYQTDLVEGVRTGLDDMDGH